MKKKPWQKFGGRTLAEFGGRRRPPFPREIPTYPTFSEVSPHLFGEKPGDS
jgi:hypothetical protein